MPAVIDVVVGGDLALTTLPDTESAAASRVWRTVREATVAVANLETVLTVRGTRAPKAVAHRAAPSAARLLGDLGFDLVTLANNHSMDFGPEGLVDTMRALERTGIRRCGAGLNLAEAFRPASVDVAGQRVAVFGFSCAAPPGSAAGTDSPGIAAIRVGTSYECDPLVLQEQPGSAPYVRTHLVEDDVIRAITAVTRATGDHDIVVAFVHWGVMPLWLAPIQGCIAEYQRALAYRLVAGGARVVVGCGSHRAEPLTTLAGSLLAYGLGDLAFQRLPDASWRLDQPTALGLRCVQRLLLNTPSSGGLLPLQLGPSGITALPIQGIALDEHGNPHAEDGAERHRGCTIHADEDADVHKTLPDVAVGVTA